MTVWVMACCGLAVVATIALFASGAIHSYPSVARLIRAHDAELARVLEDCDYYRKAAQSCAAAVAHREGQVAMLEALLRRQEAAPGEQKGIVP